MYILVLIVGMVLLAFGGQGAIRLLLGAGDGGLLAWLPGGFVGQVLAYLVLAGLGLALAARGRERARRSGQLT